MSKKIVQGQADEVVVDLATVQPWHGLSPADKAQMLGETLLGSSHGPHADNEADFTASEAAASIGLAKPNGSPQDSFYTLAREHPEKIGAYWSGGKIYCTRAGIAAFKKNGGDR